MDEIISKILMKPVFGGIIYIEVIYSNETFFYVFTKLRFVTTYLISPK